MKLTMLDFNYNDTTCDCNMKKKEDAYTSSFFLSIKSIKYSPKLQE